MPDKFDIRVHVVAASLLGKYTNWEYERLLGFITDIPENKVRCQQHYIYRNKSSVKALFIDAERQLGILRKIDLQWLNAPLTVELLVKMNRLSRGLNTSEPVFRTDNYVADLGGNALTPSSAIKGELATLVSLLEQAEKSASQTKSTHATIMANLFFEIIRIHPFADGNGRTARFLVQLLARKWGYDYVLIPKYRNDNNWRIALDNAKSGDRSIMANFIFNRLTPKLRQEEQ